MDVQQQHQTPLQGADNLPSGTLTLANEQEVVRKAGRQAISAFLDGHNCFSVLRASGKVVVFDTRIPIQLAFYALVEHGTYVEVPRCTCCRPFRSLVGHDEMKVINSPAFVRSGAQWFVRFTSLC